jgi:hypothetical protein
MNAVVIELFNLLANLPEDVKVIHLYKENAPNWGALANTINAPSECGEERLQCQDGSLFLGVGIDDISFFIHFYFDGFKGFEVFYDCDKGFNAIHSL